MGISKVREFKARKRLFIFLATIQRLSQPFTVKEVCEETKQHQPRVWHQLRELIESGQVREIGRKAGSRAPIAYEIVNRNQS